MDTLLSISTFLLMIFTGLYVFFTYKLQKETKRSVDEINRPEVVITLHLDRLQPDRQGPIIYELKLGVMNMGTRTARKIRLQCDKSFIPASCSPLYTYECFQDEINILPDKKRQTYLLISETNISKIFDDGYYEHRESKTKVKVEYKSINGTVYTDEFVLDFNNRKDHNL